MTASGTQRETIVTPKSTSNQKKRLWQNITLQLIGMVGIGLLIYPEAANWVNSLEHNSEVSGYVREIENTAPEDRQRILDAAYNYNEQLEPGPLTDPYLTEAEDAESVALFTRHTKKCSESAVQMPSVL